MEGSVTELFQRWTGTNGRECSLFDGPGSVRVDATAVCHEVRSAQLVPGERLCASFRVLGRRLERQVFSALGELRELKALQLDEVVQLSVWAALGEPTAKDAERRPCGEIRVPLRHLMERCDGMLYRTWIALESPGLNDSVNCAGHAAPASDAEAFDQALSGAPRQVFQPKACITICKLEDLGPGRQPLWTPEATNKERVARWGALLRSQKQHVLLATAQHLQGTQAQRGQHAQAEQEIQELEAQARAQVQEQEALRERLRSRQESLRAEVEQQRALRQTSLRELQERGARQLEESRELAVSSVERAARRSREAEATAEAERQRELGEQLQQQREELEEEIAGIRREERDKMDAADVNMGMLRQKRDDALRQVQQWKAEQQQLQQELEMLKSDTEMLEQQKESLMTIVEDLHQTCNSHGLGAATEAINSIARYRFP